MPIWPLVPKVRMRQTCLKQRPPPHTHTHADTSHACSHTTVPACSAEPPFPVCLLITTAGMLVTAVADSPDVLCRAGSLPQSIVAAYDEAWEMCKDHCPAFSRGYFGAES